MSKVSVFVSQSDLEQLMPKLLEEKGIEYLLNTVWGFDKNTVLENGTWYDSVMCDHRNRQGKIVRTLRYTGIERSDQAWIKNGMPSEELLLQSRNDSGLIEELKRISKRRIS